MTNIKQICVPISQIYSKPNDVVALETEALYGETFEIFSSFNEWAYGKLATDGYLGWIKKIDLGSVYNNNYRICNSFSIIKQKPNDRSKTIVNLSMGSLLNACLHDNKWFKVRLNLNDSDVIGYIPSAHVTKVENVKKNWINYAKFFLSSPYKWGGRSYLGLDCSALLQLSLQISGIHIKRNTRDQIKSNFFRHVKKSEIKKGCIIFWPGHVGIMTTKKHIIHSNSTTCNTVIQKLSEVENIIYRNTGKCFKSYEVVC